MIESGSVNVGLNQDKRELMKIEMAKLEVGGKFAFRSNEFKNGTGIGGPTPLGFLKREYPTK